MLFKFFLILNKKESIAMKFLAKYTISCVILLSILMPVSKTQDSAHFLAHNSFIRSTYFNDDATLITSSDDSNIKIWKNMPNLTTIKVLKNSGPFNQVWSSILMNNDILIAGSNNKTNIWNITKSAIINTLYEHTDRIWAIAIISSKGIIATGSWDCSIKIWNISLNYSISTLIGHISPILALKVLSNDTLASGSYNTPIIIWNITNSKIIKYLYGHASSVYSLLALKLNSYLLSGSSDGSLKIWNVSNSTCLATLNGNFGWVLSALINDSIVATASSNETSIKLWNLITYKNIANLTYKIGLYRSIAYSPVYDVLVGGLASGYLTIFYNISTVIQQAGNHFVSVKSNFNEVEKTEETTHQLTSTTVITVDKKTHETMKDNKTRTEQEFASNFLLSLNQSIISIESILSAFSNDSLKSKSILTYIFENPKYDLNDCLTNCSTHGVCELSDNKFKCICDQHFEGSRCEKNLKPCSYQPCLNHLVCEDMFNNTSNYFHDFKCHCKEKYFGKRCELKSNICGNETCSGNGYCKIVNETIVCHCFGHGHYEGEKCQTKSTKLKVIQSSIKTAVFISIIILISFYSIIILSDIFNLKIKQKKKSNIKNKKTKISKRKT